jgi:16S rRNA (cytosine967-C5)-methyltransferase
MADRGQPAGGSQDRAKAARVLTGILVHGRTTDQSFGTDDELSPLIREMVYGTLRHYYTLNDLVAKRLDRELRSKDHDLRCLLLVGAYQLHYMRIPDYAAINETVGACRGLRKPWARGLVNAVLRSIARMPKATDRTNKSPNERSYELPEWIVKKFDAFLGEQSEPVKRACLARAPMCLRVNLRKLSREDYRDRLGKAGIASDPGWQPESLILESPLPVRELPGHREGLVSVQDSGAMFAAEVLAPAETASEEPLRLLDACAAPGGKIFHLAERHPSAVLTGLEPSEPRLAHLKAEAARLGHANVRLMAGDATGNDWNPGETFHAILVDAPCSGSGTLRRHPDIKVLRSETDLVGYRTLQARLLSNLFPLLEPGGVLVYCTCSLFPDENDDVVGAFLKEHPEASVEPLTLPTGMRTRFGWQLLPLPAGPGPDMSVDGFYFARLRSNLPTDARAQGDKAG